VPLVGPIFAAVNKRHPRLDRGRLIHAAVRDLIGAMVGDLLAETRRRIKAAQPRSPDDVRALKEPVAAFSEKMRANDKALKEFLFANMYRHYRLNRMTSKARRVVRELFEIFLAEPECLPTDWRRKAQGPKTRATAELVADYIAGMTDRYALDEHRRLFDVQARSS